MLDHNPHDIEIMAIFLILQEGVSTPVKFKNVLEKKLSTELVAEDQALIERIFGDLALNSQEYDKAHDHFTACLQVRTQDHRALTGLALVELARGNHHKSMKYLHRAKLLCPYSPLIFNTMGTIYELLNNLKEAMVSYQWCLCLMPEHINAETRLRKLLSLGEIRELQEINVDSILHMRG